MTQAKLEIEKLIKKALAELNIAIPSAIHLEHPGKPEFGDYSTNIALSIKTEYKNPHEFATVLVDKINAERQKSQSPLLEKVSLAGPGFINFTLSQEFLLKEMEKVLDPTADLVEQTAKGKEVIVEYSSPNIAKPFTIGHLRTTIIGDAVANLMEATGWKVFRDNHLGDWGTQFGKQTYAIKHFGDEKQIEESESPVKELVTLYVRFHQEAELRPELEDEARMWFKRLEDGDPEVRRLWKKCVDWSMKEFNRIYAKLGIHFTENDGKGYGESFFEDKMTAIIEELEKKDVLKMSEGAKLVFFPNDELPPLMMIKKDGATLYATRDLATDKFRLQKYGKDILVINEVGAEQSLYWQQIFRVEEMLGWYKPGQRVHVKHGMYRFKDKKMSTRKGNVIWLEDVLNEAYQRVYLKTKDVLVKKNQEEPEVTTHSDHRAEEEHLWKIAIGALKWNDLKREAIKEIAFDWNEILTLQGNSGPYLQYTYARCQSVLRKGTAQTDSQILKRQKSGAPAETTYVLNAEERTVLRLAYQFSEVITRAAEEYAPHYVCTYLFEFAQAFNTFYNKHSILGEENSEEEKLLRLHLTQLTAKIIQHGLHILGIETVETM